MTKKRTLDVEKVSAALKRAAQASLHGSADERAGRFIGRDSATGQFMPKPSRNRSADPARAASGSEKRK